MAPMHGATDRSTATCVIDRARRLVWLTQVVGHGKGSVAVAPPVAFAVVLRDALIALGKMVASERRV